MNSQRLTEMSMSGVPSGLVRTAKLAALAVLVVVGWLFVLWANKFRVTAPVAFVCMGYVAVVAAIVSLWRTGSAMAVPDDPQSDWGRPIGPRGELEKAKRTLLKAIKEAEFDLAMGKLSQGDADALIQTYRLRAIEIIKELDRLEAGSAMSSREQIRREVNARVALVERRAQGKPVKSANETDRPSAEVSPRGDADPSETAQP